MTAIIAIKEGKRIMIGADGRTSTDVDAFDCYNRDHFKIRKIDGSPNCLIACTGEVSRNYIISRIPNLLDGKDDVTYSYLIKHTLPKIFNALKEHNLIVEDDDYNMIDSNFIIATKSHLFKVDGYGVVTEFNSVAFAGSGQDMLAVKYISLKEKKLKIEDRIEQCLRHSIKYGQSIGFPIVMLDNFGKEYIIEKD